MYLATVEPLAEGLTGTDQTVTVMRRLAVHGTQNPGIRLTAENIVRRLPQRDFQAETRAVEAWVRHHLRFTRDGLKVETLKAPQWSLREIAKHGVFLGDCDDASVLGASLLMSLGHAVAFQVVGRGRTPHHVNVLDRTTHLVVDPTGEPAGVFGFRRLYDVNPD